MKRILLAFWVCIIILNLSACSSENKTDYNTIENSSKEISSKINLNDYVSMKFYGMNLEGYAFVTFDVEKFLVDHIKDVSFNKENVQAYRELYGDTDKSAAYYVTKYISVSLDKEYNLSNGDTVQTVWKIDTEKIETYFVWDCTFESKEFIVTGLKEADSFESSNSQEIANTTTTNLQDNDSVDSSASQENTNTTNLQGNTVTMATSAKDSEVFNPSTSQGDTSTTIPELNDNDSFNPTNPQEEDIIYAIVYVNNGGTHSNPTAYTIKDEIELSVPKKTGYTFLGWTYEGQTTPVLDVKIPKGSTGWREYVANWKANTYKITYNANGGSVNDKTQIVNYDDYYTLVTPTRKGYTFEGWYNGETLYYGGIWEIANDVTLKAKWSINNYYVSLNHTGHGSVSGEGLYEYNSTVTVSAKSKLGYTWLGWYDENDNCVSTRQVYSFNMEDYNVTLQGKWKISDDISEFKFTSTETTCTITDVIDDSKSTYTIPKYVTSIGDHAFFMCDYLTSITIPSSVTSIGENAFTGCDALKNIVLPNSLTSIGDSAFSSCDSLINIVIPNSVTRISEYTFSSCHNLSSVVIHKNVTFIGKNAFSGCTKLTSITFQGAMSDWNAITIGKNWNFMVPATEVACSNGTITLS